MWIIPSAMIILIFTPRTIGTGFKNAWRQESPKVGVVVSSNDAVIGGSGVVVTPSNDVVVSGGIAVDSSTGEVDTFGVVAVEDMANR